MKNQSFPITVHVEVYPLDDEEYAESGLRPLTPDDVRFIAAQTLKDLLSKALNYEEHLTFEDQSGRVGITIRGISVSKRGGRAEVAGRKRSR